VAPSIALAADDVGADFLVQDAIKTMNAKMRKLYFFIMSSLYKYK